MKRPELLAPAGNLEKLKTALLFGADAVYVGNSIFGLRKYADNFNSLELKEGIQFAHQRQKRVYVVLNGFAQESDLEPIKNYIKMLENLKPDALIISDIAVLQLAKQYSTIPIHISTQASASNVLACNYYQSMGASRIILARELSITECKTICTEFTGECEVFVHGAMCASYSGKCVISNYTTGRDSNRGGCVQSCRHHYQVQDQINGPIIHETSLMNAKDLWSIKHLKSFCDMGMHSLKIEGRMKSNMYLANVVSVYHRALNELEKTGNISNINLYETQLSQVSNRGFSDEHLSNSFHDKSMNTTTNSYYKNQELTAIIKAIKKDDGIILETKQSILNTDTLSCLNQSNITTTLNDFTLLSLQNEQLSVSHANQLVKIKWQESFKNLRAFDILYKQI